MTNHAVTEQAIDALPKVLDALLNLISADNCNYDRALMRSEGYFDQARIAYQEATGITFPYPDGEQSIGRMREALALIIVERVRQDAKWGEQNHDPFTYLTVLTEEVGELAQAALHTRFGGEKAAGLLDEAVQTAAVALAIVECLLRGAWLWPDGTPR